MRQPPGITLSPTIAGSILNGICNLGLAPHALCCRLLRRLRNALLIVWISLRQHALLLETFQLLFVISLAVGIDARGFLEKIGNSRCIFIARRLTR